MLAAQVDNKKLAILGHNRSMLARHARIGDHQVAIHLAPHGIRSVIQRQRLLIVSLHENRDRKDSGDTRMRREVDMFPELSCGPHASKDASILHCPTAFYDVRGLAGAGKKLW